MNEWDKIYQRGEQLNRWPFTDLVSLVKRYMPDLEGKHVLELGCGTGNNSRFFTSEKAQYCGMDIVGGVVGRAPGVGGHFVSGDFTRPWREPVFRLAPYDIICDRAAVTHNDTESIRRCLAQAYDALKPGGLYIGVDWFSTQHWASRKGEEYDEWTRIDIQDGQFKGVGKVHFSTVDHLYKMFRKFFIEEIQMKEVRIVIAPEIKENSMTFNIVAKKLA